MEQEEIQSTKRVLDRSTAYPALNLPQAIEAMGVLRKNLGANGKYSRESAAQGLSYAGLSGAAARKVAALVHYGLLDRDGNTYTASSLSESIYLERSPEEKMEAIKVALQRPKLFYALIKRYEGNALPAMLPNILAREYGINQKIAPNVSDIFKKSAEYAGVLVNGVIGSTSANTSPEAPYEDEALGGFQKTQASLEGKYSPETSTQIQGFASHSMPGLDYSLDSGVVIIFPESCKKALFRGEFAAAISAFEKAVEAIIPGSTKEQADQSEVSQSE